MNILIKNIFRYLNIIIYKRKKVLIIIKYNINIQITKK